MKIEINNRFNGSSIISGDYDSIKDCLKKNSGADLDGANLRGANLRGANLDVADLRGANLDGADLRGAKGYANSHDIFQEIIRRQQTSVFTDIEWSAIAQITIHRLCWDSIKKRFSGVMPHIFTVLAEAGFPKWLEYWDKGG